jgi:hypothetical protein
MCGIPHCLHDSTTYVVLGINPMQVEYFVTILLSQAKCDQLIKIEVFRVYKYVVSLLEQKTFGHLYYD